MKKFTLGFCAIILAISMSAFTAKKSESAYTNKYFKYLDYPNDLNANNPNRYELSGDLGCPAIANHRCAVIAPSNGATPERPILTDPSVIIKKKN